MLTKNGDGVLYITRVDGGSCWIHTHGLSFFNQRVYYKVFLKEVKKFGQNFPMDRIKTTKCSSLQEKNQKHDKRYIVE
jgi:hypothetical protein